MKCLIIYASRFGQTERIAQRIAETMRSAQALVDVHSADSQAVPGDIGDYDIVVAGSPIYFGKHSRLIEQTISRQLAMLQQKTGGFFSVSLSASGGQKQQEDANRCISEFLEKLGWKPDVKSMFGGGLPYRKYGWLTRMLMKWVSGREGGDIDTSRDHEYTDWNAVDGFALDLMAIASSGRAETREVDVAEPEVGELARVMDYDPPAAYG